MTKGLRKIASPLRFRDLTLDFHLVPDDFPIEDGLIGSKTLRSQINYEEDYLKSANHVIILRCGNNVNLALSINSIREASIRVKR